MMDAGRFSAMAVDGKDLVMYDQNNFQRNTALKVWKRCRNVSQKKCIGTIIDARFAVTNITQCQQEVFCCHRLRYNIYARIKVEGGDPQLQCWFSDKPYTSYYLMYGGSRSTRTLKLKVFQQASVRNLSF